MRVVVTGAAGGIGTRVPAALGRDPQVTEIVGLARRVPVLSLPKVRWRQADVTVTPLAPHLQPADAGWIDLAGEFATGVGSRNRPPWDR